MQVGNLNITRGLYCLTHGLFFPTVGDASAAPPGSAGPHILASFPCDIVEIHRIVVTPNPPPGGALAMSPGQVSQPVHTLTTDTVLTATSDPNQFADASAGPIAITLPPATNGLLFHIKKLDATANPVTIIGTVEGQANAVITIQNTSLMLRADGTSWKVT